MKDIEYPDDNKHIELTDLPLVSALKFHGFNYIATNKDPKHPGKVGFVFKHSQALEDEIGKFWNSELKVDPKAYSFLTREIKSQINTIR